MTNIETFIERSRIRQRPPTLLEKETALTRHSDEEDVFVSYHGRVATAGRNAQHHDVAEQTNLHYHGEKGATLVVDDGGHIYDDGDKLVIRSYFTQSTRPKELWEAMQNEEMGEPEEYEKYEKHLEEVRKNIRKKTGQLVANITGRNVLVQYGDGAESMFSPEN